MLKQLKKTHLLFVMLTYFVFGKSDRTGCAVGSVVQVLVVGRVVADVDGQNKTARKDPAQGVVHLRRCDHSVTFYQWDKASVEPREERS